MSENTKHKYLYGPVPSRRLGLSLGVDVVPFKTCTYNCVYCQLGPTPETTCERRPYVKCEDLLREVRERVCEPGFKTDYIAVGGSGEPTLNTELGCIIRGIKDITDLPVAVLTNGSLFSDEQVRDDVMAADVILPSLDAGSEHVFDTINRPCADIDFERMLSGLEALRNEFLGEIWLEVFLVQGVNTDEDELMRIKTAIGRIKPDRVHLNTAVRPPAEADVKQLPAEKMEPIRAVLGDRAEVIASYSGQDAAAYASGVSCDDIVGYLERRPGSLEDMAHGLGAHPNELIKHIRVLLDQGDIVASDRDSDTYYEISRTERT